MIDSLSAQDYSGPMEFILVDDKSEDQTEDIIRSKTKADSRFVYVSSEIGDNNLKYKKRAIDAGIRSCSNELLLFTDVDCILPRTWVSRMVSYFESGYEYLVGLSFTNRTYLSNIITQFQRIDYMLLMVICRGSSFLNSPLASSGQNQGYRKSLYQRVGGFSKINKFIGDDTPFLHLCLNQGAHVTFVDSLESSVYSREETNLFNLLIQKARWAFDANQIWRVNFKFYILLLSVYLLYLIIPLSIIFSITSFKSFLILFCTKGLLELILLYIGSIKMSFKIYLKDFILWQIFHIPYIIIVGAMSFFIRYMSWRGRKLSL